MRLCLGLLVATLAATLACSGGDGAPPVDASPPDSFADSALPDAAEPDAASPDARPLDARLPDAFSDGQPDPLACGTGTTIIELPASGVVTGMADAITPGNISSSTCNGRGAETVYRFTVDHPVTLDASTDSLATTLDTVLYVRSVCQDPATELACDDDVASGNARSHLTVPLAPGSYYLVVDGRNVGSAGSYTLTVRLFSGLGEPCTGAVDCAPGDTCRAIPPSTQLTCQPPVCSDGRDDDGDGDIDFPADPGCTGPTDDSEDDACPSGAGCPVCSNGLDDDGDGLTDYPQDSGCLAASGASEESCAGETEPLLLVTAATTSGTTVGATNQLTPTCAAMSTAPERVHTLRVPHPLASLVIDTNTSPFDTVLSFLTSTCTTSLACDDDSGDPGTQSRITHANVAAGTYQLAVDGFNASAGAYVLHVAGVYPNGGACAPGSPLFACPTGTACAGTAGAETCRVTACNDTVDDDGAGDGTGYPSDPGCTSLADTSEDDDCPSGPGCPVCSNDLDDDGDGLIDYPNDPGCSAASGTTELCTSVDAPRALTANVTGQSTGTLANDAHPTCGLDGRDEVWTLTLPHGLFELRVDTIGSSLDTVVAVKTTSCATADLACDDNSAGNGDSLVVMNGVAAGVYTVVVDDRGTAIGTYNLNVSGRYFDGGTCDPTSTRFRCSPGFTCAGATPICRLTACNDGVDNDGDGLVGYPSDPGCTSVDDDSEADTCPSGAGCPACSNGLDDDSDGTTDYPADPSCSAASSTAEAGCAPEHDPLVMVTAATATGTTIGATNDFVPSCSTSGTRTAPDRVHLVTLAVPVASLTADTTGTAFDTTLSWADSTCAMVTACDDDAGPGNTSLLTRTNVAPGTYALIVDAFSTQSGPYTLNVRGTLASGASCADPLVAAGVLACPTGTTCQAGVCTP